MVASLAGHAFGRVDHQQRHVRGFQMPPRHDHAQFFRHQLRLALAPDSRRIDKAQRVALELHYFVDRVARGARDRRHDGARGPSERVEQRRFADIRPPDDRHRSFALLKFAVGADFFLVRGFAPGARGPPSSISSSIASSISSGCLRFASAIHFRSSGIASAIASSSSPTPWPVLGTHGKTFADAELAKILGFVGERVGLDLVDGEKQRLASALEQEREVVVGPRQLGAHVHHHHQRVGLFERHLGLFENLGGNEFGIVGHNAARVHEPVAAAPPTRTRHRCGRA